MRQGPLPSSLRAAATLSWPSTRSRLITLDCKVAITQGPVPVRIWEASSPQVTSLTQCSAFSIR